MPVQFFGQFLLGRNIIDREQLLDAVAYQDEQNLKLGEYAVQREYITVEDAERINRLQQTKDVRFGDAAVELKLLTTAQVEELVTIQRNNHVYLGDAVVQKGHADAATIEAALDQFQKEQETYKTGVYDLEGLGVVGNDAHEICIDLTTKFMLRIWGVVAKIDTSKSIEDAVELPGRAVQVSFFGEHGFNLLLCAPKSVIAQGCLKILAEESPAEDTLDDILREFANVVCGNVLAMLARRGIAMNISPPMTLRNDVKLGQAKALRTPLVTPSGEMIYLATFLSA